MMSKLARGSQDKEFTVTLTENGIQLITKALQEYALKLEEQDGLPFRDMVQPLLHHSSTPTEFLWTPEGQFFPISSKSSAEGIPLSTGCPQFFPM